MLVQVSSLANTSEMASRAEMLYFTLSQYYASKLRKSTGPNTVPEISKENVFHYENFRAFVFKIQGWSLIFSNLHEVARQSTKQNSRLMIRYFLPKF